jgi:hypothetical protein
MFNPRSIPYLPTQLTERSIVRAALNSLARVRFDRSVGDWNTLVGLYARTFDLELAISRDLCAVPPGWIEDHRVLLPDAFQPVRQDQIEVRLERMLHAPRDPEAIKAILAAASYVTGDTADGTRKRRRYILSVPDLAGKLVRAQALNAGYVDALLRGRLGRCMEAIAKCRLGTLPQSRAVELLLTMARMWALHDLQVVAAKLHQAMDSPTRGLFERKDAGAQPFQAVMKDPTKMGEMAEIATRLLRREPVDGAQPKIKDQARFWGFVTGTEFKDTALEVGAELGFTPEELTDVKDGTFANVRKIAKLLRRYTVAAKVAGVEIDTDLAARWDDRAPTRKTKAGATKSLSHLSAAAIRYGLEAPAALAYAIVAFIDLAEQLPEMIARCIAGEPIADVPHDMGSHIEKGDRRVTFELMFAAYRAVFLRDPNYLRDEIKELMPTNISPNIFTSKTARKNAQRDFIMGVTASVSERLGSAPLTAADGIDPETSTTYGADSLDKALAILKRDQKEGIYFYNPQLTPAIAWRLSN